MKKFIYLAAVLLTAFGISSCQNDEPELTQQNNAKKVSATSNEPEAEYTICFYGGAGGNLDGSIAIELLENVDAVESTKGKVRVVGLYKPAKKANDMLGKEGGIRYFELKRNEGITPDQISQDCNKLKNEDLDEEQLTINAANTFVKDFAGEKYADASFQMFDPSSMADAFRYLTQKAPAKKYILMCVNHGEGWNLATDTPCTTRGMISDDNIKGQPRVSLDQLRAGVKMSGIKFDVLFCDLCLMATLENLYGYSDTFPICIASAETTTGSMFGYFAQRLANLGGNASHDQLFNECSEWVTTTDSNRGYRKWETMNDFTSLSSEFQDMGCYDLTKIGNLTSSLQDISRWFNKAMADKDLRYVVEKSALTTLYTATPSDDSYESFNRQSAIEFLKKGYSNNMTVDSLADQILNGHDGEMYNKLTNCSDKNIKDFYWYQRGMYCGYPMAYFVWNTARVAKQYNMTTEADELQTLLDHYEAALKSMCRIKCSYEDFGGYRYDGVNYPAMDPYLWTSPTVTITSLNKNGFQDNHVIGYSTWVSYSKISLGQAVTDYNNTKFDQLTNWSNFLKQLDYNPNIVTNFYRLIPVYYSKPCI